MTYFIISPFKNFRLGVVALIILMLSACMPPVDFTIENGGVVSQRKDAELKLITIVADYQSQQAVKVFPSILPVWKEALTDVLGRSLMFKDDVPMKVNLSVRVFEIIYPHAGLSFTTRVSAIYEIIDRKSGDILFSHEVTSEGVVPFSHSLNGGSRLMESINRAVRNNITDFLNQLERTDFTKPN